MSAVRRPVVELQLPHKLLPILEPRRFKIMHGGRGGGKSHTVAQVLLMLATQRKLRVLCVREVQKSLKESSMQVLKDYITRLGLEPYFEVLVTEIRCRLTGSTFGFSGLKDHTADSIKSWEGADIVWVEEAHSVTAHSWNILIPTIRKAGSEIWATFNPDQPTDYVYDRFIKHTDPKAWVCEINWRDNPWFGEEMEDERRALKATNDDLYAHVWEGQCRTVAGLMFKRVWFEPLRYDLGSQPGRLNCYIASDWAGGPDPDNPDSEPDFTEHGVAGLDEHGDLWFTDWWSGQEDPNEWIQAWLAMLRKKPKPIVAFEEKGVIRRSVDGAINKAMRESQTFITRTGLPSAGSKAERALGFAARAAARTVHIPNTPWGDRLIEQLCAFNGQDGRTDDMVDVCSLLARGLDEMADATKPEKDTRPKPPVFGTGEWLDRFDKADAAEEARVATYYK